MEAAALNAPPAWLERIVVILIPPRAREAVAGDLCETYISPRGYAVEALRTVPFVIASQARRNLNLPVLMLQAALVLFFFGPAFALAFLPLQVIAEAYRESERPCPRRAIRETLVVALTAVLFLQVMGVAATRLPGRDDTAWMSLYFLGPMISPLLCFLRTGLIVDSDRRPVPAIADRSAQELAAAYRAFAARIQRRNFTEAAALVLAALVLLWQGAMPALVLGFALAPLYLAVEGAARSLPARADFTALRVLYQRELGRQQQLRRFLWWLWCTPVLVALHGRMIEAGTAAGRPLLIVLGGVAAFMVCFLVGALNREQDGRLQEEIRQMDRMRERLA
jgi:hypothetical protein